MGKYNERAIKNNCVGKGFQTAFRLDIDIAEKLNAAAKARNVTFSQEIRDRLRHSVDNFMITNSVTIHSVGVKQ